MATVVPTARRGSALMRAVTTFGTRFHTAAMRDATAVTSASYSRRKLSNSKVLVTPGSSAWVAVNVSKSCAPSTPVAAPRTVMRFLTCEASCRRLIKSSS